MKQNAMAKLTDLQREQWAVDGFIQLEGALSPEEVKLFSEEIDRIRLIPGYEPGRAKNRPLGHYEWVDQANPDMSSFMDRRDLLPYHQAFIDLIDRPNVFDLIVDIMGPYLQFSMSQAIVRGGNDGFPGYTHTDGGQGQRLVRVTETSAPIAMKAMYLLTDVNQENSGNFTVYPGSHMRSFPKSQERTPNPHGPGAVQLMGKAGDCYLFSHSLWHGPAPNHTDHGRKTILYNYSQMFVRWYDYGAVVPEEILSKCSNRQRRLLGDLGYEFRPGSYFYVPEDQEAVIYQDESLSNVLQPPHVNA